jgi:hypothetical protein
MRFVIFEAVQILVTFAADLAFVWLLFFHSEGSGIRRGGFGIDNRKCPISIVVKALIIVAVLEIGQPMSKG